MAKRRKKRKKASIPKPMQKLLKATKAKTPKKRRMKKMAGPFATRTSNRGSAQETLNKQTQKPVEVPPPADLPETKPRSESIPSQFQENMSALNLVKKITPTKQKQSATPFFI
jgi:hypothetical protein